MTNVKQRPIFKFMHTAAPVIETRAVYK